MTEAAPGSGPVPPSGPGPDLRPAGATLAARALRLACPLCGHRPLFHSWVRMDERCGGCDLRFERVVGQWFGSLAFNTIISFGALLLVVLGSFLAAWPDAPPAGALVAGVAVALLLPIVAFPWSRTLWLALDLRLRPLEPDEAPGLMGRTARSGNAPVNNH